MVFSNEFVLYAKLQNSFFLNISNLGLPFILAALNRSFKILKSTENVNSRCLGKKFRKLSKIGFSMEYFTTEL